MKEFQMMDVWIYGDVITRTVTIILLLMSIATWTIIILGCIRSWRFHRQQKQIQHFWSAASFQQAIDQISDNQSPWKILAVESDVATQGFDKTSNNKNDLNAKADWLLRAFSAQLERYAALQRSGLGLLSSIGATAPFVGLFGTVWGIYHTLIALSGSSGQMTIDQVAGPIGEALIMTAVGLAVAIPAVWGNNALATGNRKRLEQIHTFANELQIFHVTGQKPTSVN